RYSTATALCRDLERIQRGESILRRREWEAIARQIRRVVPAMGVGLLLLALVLLSLNRRPTTAMPSMAPGPAVGRERASVFVLPFRIADHARPGPAFSSIEISDAFRDALASLEGVWRSPRRSGWESREESELLSSLARTNDFRHVLAGLVDASNGTHSLRLRLHERAGSSLCWEGTYSTTHRDAVALERAALDGLLDVLGVRLSGAESARLDRLLQAKAEALRLLEDAGRLYGRSFLVYTGVTEMIALTERARQIDPQSIGACLFRGIIVRDQALFSRPPMEAWPEAEREFTAVLDVDPTVTAALNQRAGAWVVRGWDWAWFDWHLQEEMRWQPELIRAFLRAAQLRIHGDMEASKRAQALVEAGDPTDFGTLLHCAYAQWTYRDYDKGLNFARRAAELYPDAAWPDFQIALLTAESGDYEETLRAIDRVERRTRFQLLTALRGYTYARMGQPDRARQVLESLFAEGLHQTYVQPYPIARVYAALGEREKALDWLEKAESDRSEFLVLTDAGGLRTDPAWDGLQDHPRFQALLKKVGLDVWPVPIQAPP
ncbi:MAG: hypothetical protein L6Q38_17100, partial [Nitrospira sp.]|nr:hypothetical protein [Nitrospira sp.]